MGADGGIPGWFIGFFVLILVLGAATTIWRVSTARRLARDAGLDPGRATAVTLLSQDGIDAAYLASTFSRSQPPAARTPARTAEQRLQELQSLKDRGLITASEYDARRAEILRSI